MYSPWQDGVLMTSPFVNMGGRHAGDPTALNGWGKIVGIDPQDLLLTNAGELAGPRGNWSGRYPAAIFAKDGVVYYGVRSTAVYDTNGNLSTDPNTNYRYASGTFIGFHTSTDGGASWSASPNADAPLVNEPHGGNQRLKFGQPYQVDFGKNQERSPDGKVYFVSSGSTDTSAGTDHLNDDQVYPVQRDGDGVGGRDQQHRHLGVLERRRLVGITIGRVVDLRVAQSRERSDDDVEPGAGQVPDAVLEERLLGDGDEDGLRRVRQLYGGVVVDDGPVEAGALLAVVRQAGLLSEPAVEVPVVGRPERLALVRLELLPLGPRAGPARERLPPLRTAHPVSHRGGYAVGFHLSNTVECLCSVTKSAITART